MPTRDPCPSCGFHPATVSPSDATVATRSYPRRYRALLVRPDDEEGAAVVTRRPAPDQWSALEHAAHVADVVALVATAVRALQRRQQPEVRVEPGPPTVDTVDAVLERLTAACGDLAAALGEVAGRDWQRTGRLPTGGVVTPLDLAREAVHVGAHHRREIERLLTRRR